MVHFTGPSRIRREHGAHSLDTVLDQVSSTQESKFTPIKSEHGSVEFLPVSESMEVSSSRQTTPPPDILAEALQSQSNSAGVKARSSGTYMPATEPSSSSSVDTHALRWHIKSEPDLKMSSSNRSHHKSRPPMVSLNGVQQHYALPSLSGIRRSSGMPSSTRQLTNHHSPVMQAAPPIGQPLYLNTLSELPR